MNQDFTTPGTPETINVERLKALNTAGTISYILHLIVAIGAIIPGGQWGPILLIVALVLDMATRGDAEGTWHASHFRWRIRSVVIAGVLYLVTSPLWVLFIIPGWIAWTLISIWFLYRIVVGFIAMNQGREVGA